MQSIAPSVSNRHEIFPPSEASYSRCPNCCFDAWCLPANLAAHEAKKLNDRIEHRRLIKRNEYLHYAGMGLTSLFVIKSGFLKTKVTNRNGREQITGFSMAGELVGLDAIGEGKHQCDTAALVDSHLCAIAYVAWEQLILEIPALQRHFHRAMSAEIVRDHGIMLLLGAMRAEERVGIFLLNLSMRFSARGYSGTHFMLPMTRQDIASYLGLKMETVSRVFSHFHNNQVIAINNKNVEIRSLARLQEIVGDYEPGRFPAPRTKSDTC